MTPTVTFSLYCVTKIGYLKQSELQDGQLFTHPRNRSLLFLWKYQAADAAMIPIATMINMFLKISSAVCIDNFTSRVTTESSNKINPVKN